MSFGFQNQPGGASQHPPPSSLSNPYAPFPQQPGAPPQPGAPHQPGAPPYQPGAPSFQPGAPPFQPGAPSYQPGAPFPGAPPGGPQHQFGGPQNQFGGPHQGAPPPYSAPGAPPYQPPPYHSSGPQAGFQPGVAQPQHGQERTAVIRNAGSGLVLDGTDYEIKLQRYTGAPAQLWIMEPAGGGKFVIKNKQNGMVIDIEGGPDCGNHLITYDKHGGPNQQWYINNPDNTIVSAAGNLAFDIYEGNCYPGNIVIAYEKHGGPNQQFQLQYQ